MIRISDKMMLICSSFSTQVLRILTVFFMARLIGPIENGAYSLILIVAGFVAAMSDFAIPATLVQIRDVDEDCLFDSAIALTFVLYGLYGVGTFVAGLVLAHRHADSTYWKVALLISLTSLLAVLYSVQMARINRQLHFRRETVQNLVASLSTTAAGITFALLGWGIYAIAMQVLVGQLIANLALNIHSPLRWPAKASWRVAIRYLRTGFPISAAGYVGTLEGNIVGLLVNSFRGVEGVGLWAKTIQVQGLFSQNLTTAFQRVAYPLLCRDSADHERMRSLLSKVVVTMMLASLFFAAVVAVNSESIVRVALGTKWLGTIPLLQITAWAIPAGAIFAIGYMLSMALNNNGAILRGSIINLCVFLPFAFLFGRKSFTPLVICWTVSRYLIAWTVLYSSMIKIKVRLAPMGKDLAELLLACIVASGAMLCVNAAMGNHLPVLMRLCISGAAGLLAFATVAFLIQRETIVYAWRLARGTPVQRANASDLSNAAASSLSDPVTAASPDSQAYFLAAAGALGPPAPVIEPPPDNAENKSES